MSGDQWHVQKLKEELSKLKELQTHLTKQAVFGGMSAAEAQEYEARQQRIKEINRVLRDQL